MGATRYFPFAGRLLLGLPFAMSGLGKLAAIGPTTESIRNIRKRGVDARRARCLYRPVIDEGVTKVNGVLTAILVAFVLVFGTSHVLASPKSVSGDSSRGDWVYVDHDLAGTRYSHL